MSDHLNPDVEMIPRGVLSLAVVNYSLSAHVLAGSINMSCRPGSRAQHQAKTLKRLELTLTQYDRYDPVA